MTVKNEILGTGFRQYDVEEMNAMDTCLRRYDIRENNPKNISLGIGLRGNDSPGGAFALVARIRLTATVKEMDTHLVSKK